MSKPARFKIVPQVYVPATSVVVRLRPDMSQRLIALEETTGVKRAEIVNQALEYALNLMEQP